jgi:hypothetical protein
VPANTPLKSRLEELTAAVGRRGPLEGGGCPVLAVHDDRQRGEEGGPEVLDAVVVVHVVVVVHARNLRAGEARDAAPGMRDDGARRRGEARRWGAVCPLASSGSILAIPLFLRVEEAPSRASCSAHRVAVA